MRALARRALAVAPILVICALPLAACEDDETSGPSSFSFDAGMVGFDVAQADSPVSELPDAADIDVDAALVCDGGSVSCNGVCVARVGTIDQVQNATSAGRTYLVRGDTFVQTFTAGASGQLVGIELYVQRAIVGTGPTQGSIRLTARTADGGALGSAEIELSRFEIDNSPHQLGVDPGAGYFDLASHCISVTSGASYRLELELVGAPAGVCTDGSCTAGRLGDSCNGDSQCDYRIGVELSDGDPYAGGTFLQGTNEDLIFRTYVR